ncbi:MAG: DUF885 domain-containing protein, partial [Gammaproteobacteria bacterium]
MYRSLAVVLLLGALAPLASAASLAEEALEELLAAEWERTLAETPTWASSLGDPRYNDRWPDLSMEAIEASHAADRE